MPEKMQVDKYFSFAYYIDARAYLAETGDISGHGKIRYPVVFVLY